MQKAYILIETTVGKGPEVVTQLEGIQGIEEVERVTGHFDVLAILASTDLDSLANILESRIRCLPDIVRTTTCIVVP